MKRRSLDSPPHFALFLLLPSSSSTFFNGGLREFFASYPMNPHTLSVQIHSPLKAKHKQQPKRHRVENQNVAEKPKQIGNGKGHHGRGSHHGPWWSPRSDRGGYWPARPGLARYDAFCSFCLDSRIACLGYLLWVLGVLGGVGGGCRRCYDFNDWLYVFEGKDRLIAST